MHTARERRGVGGGASGSFQGAVQTTQRAPSASRGPPQTVRVAPLGGRVSAWTEAIAALRPRVGSSGTYRIRYESYSERITRVGLRTERRGKAQVAVASKLIPCVTREACSRKQGKRTKYHIVEARAGVLFCYVQRRRCGPARTTRRKSWGGFGGSLPSAAGTPPYIHCCQGVTLDSQACTPLGWKHSRGCKR